MTKKKTTKRALLTSLLSLLLCVSMLVSSTFAWFTDEASTSVNKIQAGTLDIVLEMWNGTEWVDAEGQTLNFIKKEGAESEEILWEPGCTYELPKLRVRNNGDLWLKYQIAITGIKGNAKLNEAIEWSNGNSALDLVTLNNWASLAPNGAYSDEIQIIGHMKEEAGNEYQGLSIEGISVTVFATQLNKENDSYGPNYDKDAPALIYIGETYYSTLNEAIDMAENGEEIKVGGTVVYEFDEGANLTIDAKNVTIYSEDGAAVVFSGDGTNNTFANVTFENVTVIDNTTSYAESAWEFGYLELENVTATDVVFSNGIMIDGTSTFTDCTFTGQTEDGLKMYGVWVNSETSTFTNCTFVGTRGLKVHEAYGSEIAAVTVKGCTFEGMSEKPGIALGDLNNETEVTLSNNTFVDTQPGDGAYIKNHGVPYQYETDTDLTTFDFNAENNQTIVNVYTVEDMWAVTNVSNCVAEDGTVDSTNIPAYNMAEVTINIMSDLDMSEKWWRPICQYPSAEGHGGFAGVINGNGHTITNFKSSGNRTIDNSTMLSDGWGHCQGFIGIAKDCTVKDLTFVDAFVVSQNSLVGTIIGQSNGNNVIDNCHIIGMYAESNYYIAGIVGRAANGDVITNCTVKDVEIVSWYTTTPENYSGAIYGSISTYDHDGDSTTDKIKGTVDVTESTWKNVVIKYTDDNETKTVDATH